MMWRGSGGGGSVVWRGVVYGSVVAVVAWWVVWRGGWCGVVAVVVGWVEVGEVGR
jgi:hypothetical protein